MTPVNEKIAIGSLSPTGHDGSTIAPSVFSSGGGLTRQQGSSKLHISQPQMSYEARCCKNDTMDALTESMLRDGWDEAKAVKAMLEEKGFWSCDIRVAADRKFCQKLKEQMELEEAGASDEVEEPPAKYEVEKIVRHEKKKGVCLSGSDPISRAWAA